MEAFSKQSVSHLFIEHNMCNLFVPHQSTQMINGNWHHGKEEMKLFVNYYNLFKIGLKQKPNKKKQGTILGEREKIHVVLRSLTHTHTCISTIRTVLNAGGVFFICLCHLQVGDFVDDV